MSDCADHLAPIETTTRTAFLPALLGGTIPTTIPPDLCALLSLPIKLEGVRVPNITESADENHTTSSVCTSVLTSSLLDGTSLVIVDYQVAMHEGQGAVQSSKYANAATELSSLLVPMNTFKS